MERLTKLRKQILKIMIKVNQPVSAYYMAEQIFGKVNHNNYNKVWRCLKNLYFVLKKEDKYFRIDKDIEGFTYWIKDKELLQLYKKQLQTNQQ